MQGQGWVDSINLQVGMQIEAFAENRHLTVIALVDQQRTETTYNLEVDEFHTYFVGKMGAWVHNQNNNGPCVPCGGVVSSGKSASKREIALNSQASRDVKNVTAPIDFDGHILNAEVKSNGSVVGGHSIAGGNVRVIPGTSTTPNAQGVYKAKIEVQDPNNPSQFLPKSNNQGFSTMFPDAWSADRVKVEVDAAFKNKTVKGNQWTGVTPSGVKVKGWLIPKTTVYPEL